ncbi:hypothetical protein, partial [Mammaliicoccus lentus]|uniref:hypothetical protein n=1 Tax=Mammaliicoccus lentus TaxID=42858 RepID=UPI003519A59B
SFTLYLSRSILIIIKNTRTKVIKISNLLLISNGIKDIKNSKIDIIIDETLSFFLNIIFITPLFLLSLL